MTKGKKLNVVDFSTNVSNRIAEIESWSERIAEVLLNEPAETPSEIAELEAITDEDKADTKKPEMDFVISGGRIGNIHLNHLNANANRENRKS